MFSQWRQAVENLAQHSPKQSQDLSAEEQSRPSLDIGLPAGLSSSQLAESALANLKKTLAAQRSGSPGPSKISPSNSESATKPSAPRSTLEDRIRAKLAASEASGSSNSSVSSRATTVSPPPRPLSPASTPLPETPLSHTATMSDPLSAASSSPIQGSAFETEKLNGPEDAPCEEAVHVPAQTRPLSPASIPLPDSPALQPTVDASIEPVPEVVAAVSAADSTQSSSPADTHPLESDDITTTSTKSELQNSETGLQKELKDGAEHSEAEVTAPDGEKGHESEDVPYTAEDIASPSPGTQQNPTCGNATDAELSVSGPEPEEGLEVLHEKSSVQDSSSSETHTAEALSLEASAPAPASGSADDYLSQVSGGAQEVRQEDTPASRIDSEHTDVEALQKRLKLVEQRFADVSTSFKRLQAEKRAIDQALRELTPLESIQEVDAFRDYILNMNMKTEMTQDEIKRLTGKLTRQEERIEELRDIHRLESKSQSEQIEKLKGQVGEAEALLKATQDSTSRLEEESAKQRAENERLQGEVDRARGVAREEEEKRVKAVALLKTVRSKLVKAEKERDEALKEINSMKEKEKGEREKEQAEKAELRREIEKANAEKETAISGLKAHFDKEVAVLQDRYERELSALRGQYELEAISTKSAHSREMESRNSRISDLENSVRTLEGEKDEFFDQLQLRQAELESSRSRLESLEGQTTEFQYQLRESNDRIALLTEELADARREQETRTQVAGPSAEEVTRLLSAAEVKYESRISDLRKQLAAVERERDEGEADWSRKLTEKVRELESLRGILSSSAKVREEESESANALRAETETLKGEVELYQKQILNLRAQAERVTEIENTAKSQIAEYNSKIAALQQLIEEGKSHEIQLRASNKTLREELRKVQSSAALLERQRNPGVGYWASRQDSPSDALSPRSSVSDVTTRESISRPGSPTVAKADEDINVEYLRNVILQFLEHKEMRPHLVRILSTILRFTPQETRRLVSKV